MERKHQLSNVAFGGAWSERIAGREALTAALDELCRAARGAGSHDPRRDRMVVEALTLACGNHPKGVLLEAAWNKAAGLAGPRLRVAELTRIAALLRTAYCDGRE